MSRETDRTRTSDQPSPAPPDGRASDARADDPPETVAVPVEAAPGDRAITLPEPVRRDWAAVGNKAVHFASALFLFILAIQLMKTGARAIGPTIQGSFPFDNGISTLGFGWLGAYFVLSGSPVAGVALVLFDAGTLTRLQTFTMLSGSRLGASFIVLLVGFLYSLRDRTKDRSESIGMGVLALSLTALVYLPGMMIGYGLLKVGALERVNWHASQDILSIIDLIWGPVERAIGVVVTVDGLLLPVGLVIILVSFKLLDRVLPELDGEKHADRKGHWLRKPWPMFLLGCLAATLTLSVSVALTVLVPLASRGYVKREEAIPYIMGANITTLADTLVAAMLLGNAVAVQIVLAEAIGVSVVTLFFLALLYRPVASGVIALDDWVVKTNRRLWLFVACLFVAPVLFLGSGLVIGPITS